jgi:hypothetical protein
VATGRQQAEAVVAEAEGGGSTNNTTPADIPKLQKLDKAHTWSSRKKDNGILFGDSQLGTHAHKEYSAYLILILYQRGYDELDLFALQQSFMYWCSLMSSERHMGKVSFVNTSTLLMHKACGCDSEVPLDIDRSSACQ